MIKLDPDWSDGPRRLEDFEPGELEAFMQRGRRMQARAMGHGLRAALRALFRNETPQQARTERGELDWERLLGLDGGRPADRASR